MAQIVDYMLVSESTWDFEKAVKLMIAKGWQPLGGPFGDIRGKVSQAMVKYEPSATETALRKYAQERT